MQCIATIQEWASSQKQIDWWYKLLVAMPMASLLTHRQLAVVLARQLTSFTHISFLSPFRDADPHVLPSARASEIFAARASGLNDFGWESSCFRGSAANNYSLTARRASSSRRTTITWPAPQPSASRPGSPRRSRGWGWPRPVTRLAGPSFCPRFAIALPHTPHRARTTSWCGPSSCSPAWSFPPCTTRIGARPVLLVASYHSSKLTCRPG
jgi:hypothetical protein